MELNERQFNILLDILYYLRKNGKESSDFYFTYVNGQERFKLYNVDSDKIILKLKGFSDINCDQLKINENIEKNEIDNVVDKIEKFENIDMNEIDKAKEELKEKNEVIEKNFYDQIKRLIFSFQGKEDTDGKDIKNAECFKIIGNLGYMFNDFNATGDKRLELEVSGFCNITSDIDREKFKIKEGTVKINPNSEINKVPIVKTDKRDKAIKDAERKAERERINASGSKEEKEKVYMDEVVDIIFKSKLKQKMLLEIFKKLRYEGKIEFRKGKEEPKFIPGFNDNIDNYQLNIPMMERLLNHIQGFNDNKALDSFFVEKSNKFKSAFRKRFRKEVKKARIGEKLFGEVVNYTAKEIRKDKIRESKARIKKLDLSLKCKRIILDNMQNPAIERLINKGKKIKEEGVIDIMKKEIESILSRKYGIKSLKRRLRRIKVGVEQAEQEELNNMLEKINEILEICEYKEDEFK